MFNPAFSESPTAFHIESSSSHAEVTYKVDIDYEARLYDPNYDETAYMKHVKDWEYVYFLCQRNPLRILKSVRIYDQAYLDKLQGLGFCTGSVDPSSSTYKYFWGHHHEPEIERRLNSKLTSAALAKTHNWGFWDGNCETLC